MAKKILKQQFDQPYSIVGISCADKDYRLCWMLNQEIGLDLKRKDDIEIDIKENAAGLVFSRYEYLPIDDNVTYFILSNKYQTHHLIKAYKQADYLLIILGDLLESDYNNLIQKLKAISIIQLIFEIPSTQLKGKEQYLFE